MDVDMPDFEPGGIASVAGVMPADGGDYLPFLIALRRAVEADAPVAERVDLLRAVLAERGHQVFVNREGGAERIVNRFFPLFLNTIPGLPETTGIALHIQGLNTAAALDAASDAQILAFKGVGAAKLRAIRERCAEMITDRDAIRLDRVER